MKMFILADSETGYIVNFEIYTGKKDAPDNKGAMYHIVMRLLENHLGQGYCVFMDNYYTSPTLLLDLVSRGTDAIGTCLFKRKQFPCDALNKATLQKGDSV